jgi:hypothetical protein
LWYKQCEAPIPLPDVTLSFSKPFTSYVVDSRPNDLKGDAIESTFSGFRSTARLFKEELVDVLFGF